MVQKKQAASKLCRDGLHPMWRMFDLYQPVRVKNTRGKKEKWIPGTIVAVKGPETYLVRVLGIFRRFLHANHLIPDDARVTSSHKEMVTPEMMEHYSPLDFHQREPVVPRTRWQIQSEVDHEVSPTLMLFLCRLLIMMVI